jgi:Amt family ammonium transporter
MTGGVAAAFGARALGPRIGRYGADGRPRAIPGHSIPFAILGCIILLVGWFGFNPGSWLAADKVVGSIAVNTALAGAAGAVAAMVLTWVRSGKPDVAMTGNGLLAGLVGVTAGAWVVNGLGAIIIGLVAGVIVVFAVSTGSGSTTRSVLSACTVSVAPSGRLPWASSRPPNPRVSSRRASSTAAEPTSW